MARGNFLGEFEHLVMLAIVRAGGEAGGAGILLELERHARRGASLPAIYVTLARLVRKGYLRSRELSSSPDRGGRPRRLFIVTRSGTAVMRQTRETLERMWNDGPTLAKVGR
jgi:DNA-binding PadR family transcriptional regulator